MRNERYQRNQRIGINFLFWAVGWASISARRSVEKGRRRGLRASAGTRKSGSAVMAAALSLGLGNRNACVSTLRTHR